MRTARFVSAVGLVAAVVVVPALPAQASSHSASSGAATSSDATVSTSQGSASDAAAAPTAAPSPSPSPSPAPAPSSAPTHQATPTHPAAPSSGSGQLKAPGDPSREKAHAASAPRVVAPRHVVVRHVTPGSAPANAVARRATTHPATQAVAAAAAAPAVSVTLAGVAVDVNGSGRRDAGDAVDLTATVTAGTNDLSALSVREAHAGALTCSSTTVLAGQSVQCTVRVALTQADIDRGSVAGSVTATADDGSGPVTSAPATTTTSVAGASSLGIRQTLKQVTDADHDGRLDTGDGVRVTATVTNTGTTTLQHVGVTDVPEHMSAVAMTCAATTLAPGASITCTSGVIHVVKAQAKEARFLNRATPTGRTVAGTTVTGSTSSAALAAQVPPAKPTKPSTPSKPTVHHAVHHAAKTPKAPKPAARLSASQFVASFGDKDKDGRLDLGDTITFAVRAVNTGDFTLYGVHVVDKRLERLHVGITCGTSTLAPGASTVCTSGAVAVTRGQSRKGFGRNFAYVSARTSGGTEVRSNSTSTEIGTSTAAASSLPRTGAEVAPQLGLALGLLAGGSLMVAAPLVRRRRRPVAGELAPDLA